MFSVHIFTFDLFSFTSKAVGECQCQLRIGVSELNGKQNLPAKIKRSLSLSHTVFLSNYMRMSQGPQLKLLLRHMNIYAKVRKERGKGAFLDFQSN